MTLSKQQIIALKEQIKAANKITIIPHRNVDGDAMGSTLGLYHVLKQINTNCVVLIPNEIPNYLKWLPGTDSTLIYEGTNVGEAIKRLRQSDLIFTLDFNAFHRTGEQMESILKTIESTFVMVDHHEKPENYATYTFSSTEYGSTCQMIYDLIEQMDYQNLITKEAATCIYTGIATDSGGFRFPRTTGRTHRIVADLIDKGVDNTQIYINLYDNSNYNRLQLLGRALQNMRILPEYNTSYISLSQEDLNEFHYEKGDTEGIVNYGLTIKDIDFTAFFTELKEENIIKISFRSQGTFDVNQFARKHFNGGGHVNAAGGKSFDTLEETINKFIAILATEK